VTRRPTLLKRDLETLFSFARDKGLTVYGLATDGHGGATIQTAVMAPAINDNSVDLEKARAEWDEALNR